MAKLSINNFLNLFFPFQWLSSFFPELKTSFKNLLNQKNNSPNNVVWKEPLFSLLFQRQLYSTHTCNIWNAKRTPTSINKRRFQPKNCSNIYDSFLIHLLTKKNEKAHQKHVFLSKFQNRKKEFPEKTWSKLQKGLQITCKTWFKSQMSLVSLCIQSVSLFQRHAMFNTHMQHMTYWKTPTSSSKSKIRPKSIIQSLWFLFSFHSHKQKIRSTPKSWPPFKSSEKEENFLKRHGPNPKGFTKYKHSKG